METYEVEVEVSYTATVIVDAGSEADARHYGRQDVQRHIANGNFDHLEDYHEDRNEVSVTKLEGERLDDYLGN